MTGKMTRERVEETIAAARRPVRRPRLPAVAEPRLLGAPRMTNYTAPTPGDPVWIYEPVVGGVTRVRRATVARVTKTTFTLDNDKRYLTSHLPRLVRHGSAGNTGTWGTGPIKRLLADGDPRVSDALRQEVNRRAAKHVESALAPFTERVVRTGIEIVTPEEIETMIDALRLYQSRARDDDHPGPAPVTIAAADYSEGDPR